MIQVCVEPYCQNCPEFSPDVAKSTLRNSLDRYFCVDTTIFCEHREKCSRMYNAIKEETKNED